MCNLHSLNHGTKRSKGHDHEHAKWNRRSFLQALGLVGGGSMMLNGMTLTASRPSPLAAALSESETDRILILIRLKGGNDGLNTIVPIYDFDNYSNLRPTLRFNQNDLINLSPDLGMPNFMGSLESLWGNGAMKVVQGVGYGNQNLSHFAGSDIWASTDLNNSTQSGWLGRYFEGLYPDYIINPPEVPAAVQIGSIGNLIFDGDSGNYAFSVANPNQLEAIAESGTFHDMQNLPDCTYGDQLQFMRGTTNTTYTYAGTIHDAFSNSSNAVEYNEQGLGRQMGIVARMIKGNLGTKVYMVTLGGFDTHANQEELHQQLLADLADSVKLFYDDLASTGHDQNVLCMTISEFGRRPDENGSNGTDHGAAAPLFLFGAGLNGNGFIGDHPSLTALDFVGNLIPGIDFRQVYATVMKEWLCIDPTVVDNTLLGQTYETLSLGLTCESEPPPGPGPTFLTHFVIYDEATKIKLINPSAQHVVIELFDILGRRISTLVNDVLMEGEYEFDVRQKANVNLSSAQYIYRINAGGQNYSKSLILR